MVTRRDVLKGIGAAGAATVLMRPRAALANHFTPSRQIFDAAPFALGVASGDPTTSSVIIWTRVTGADPYQTSEATSTTTIGGINVAANPSISVGWIVANDSAFASIVASGTISAVPATGYSVHVDVTGLSAGATYYYRFTQGTSTSKTGRTKTVPVAPTSMRFAYFSCQDFPNCNYDNFRHIAQRAGTAGDLDFVIHLGDSIYESLSLPLTNYIGRYRNRHALYRADPKCREAYAQHPFVGTWDDHEVQDNYSNQTSFDVTKEAGYQAYYEHMPIRAYTDMSGGTLIQPNLATPVLPSAWKDTRVFRRFTYGTLLDLMILDCKQYRHISNGGNLSTVGRSQLAATKDNTVAPFTNLPAPNQKTWLLDALSGSTATWKCVGSTNGVVQRDDDTDSWVGYKDERWQILKHIRNNNVRRVVFLSGDRHQSRVNLCTVHDADALFDASDTLAVASEFMAPPIGSASKPAWYAKGNPDLQVSPNVLYPWIKWEEYNYHGYAVCDVSATQWVTTIMGLKDSDPALNTGTPPITPTCVKRLVQYSVTQADTASAPTLTKTLGFEGFDPLGC